MSKTCGKCGGRMEQGFVPEAKDHATRVEMWVEGAPRKKWWGLDFSGLRRLESYAPGT